MRHTATSKSTTFRRLVKDSQKTVVEEAPVTEGDGSCLTGVVSEIAKTDLGVRQSKESRNNRRRRKSHVSHTKLKDQ